MEHDTITISQATAVAAPEPTLVMPPAGGEVAIAHETAAECKPPDAVSARLSPAQPPELELLGNQIAELSARIDAATYDLLCHLHEFDRRYGWEGWRSCAHWLNWRTGLDLGAAREKLRVAAALADLNHVSAAMARGQLSYSKVRALTRVASPATEARLLAVALCSTAAQVERLVRAWRRVDRDAQPDAEQVLLASRTLSMQVDEDGMVVLRGRLPPEVGALLLRAVEAALEQVPASADGGEPTIAQRRSDALGLVAESALAGGLDPGNPADRFQVTVHVQADALPAREPAEAGPPVAAETREVSPASSEPVAPAGSRIAADTRVVSLTPAEPGAQTANLGAEQATIGAPHISAETFEVSEAAFERMAPETDLDAGLASARRRPAAWPAMPASWCCATPPAARFWMSGAGPAPCRAPCAVPCRAGTTASASFPAANRATATPITSSIGRTAGRPACRISFLRADSTTARCTKGAFGWFRLTRMGSSGSCARTARRCQRSRRWQAGKGRRWRRPTHGWRQPASASVRTPPRPSGTVSRCT